MMEYRRDNLHSRFVAWSKIILPLLALAILSSLFLFSKSHDPTKSARLFRGNLADFASKERITAPRFAGMTPGGAAIQLSAKEASPRKSGGASFDATELNAEIEMSNGAKIHVTAAAGLVDSVAMRADLTGGVTLKTSLGYTALTPGMTFSLDRVDITSLGAIKAFGPLGKIEAGLFHLSVDDKNNNGEKGYVLVFKNRVKLVYVPNK